MPHVIVKLWPGKTAKQKQQLAERITQAVMDVLHYGDESVSVASVARSGTASALGLGPSGTAA